MRQADNRNKVLYKSLLLTRYANQIQSGCEFHYYYHHDYGHGGVCSSGFDDIDLLSIPFTFPPLKYPMLKIFTSNFAMASFLLRGMSGFVEEMIIFFRIITGPAHDIF